MWLLEVTCGHATWYAPRKNEQKGLRALEGRAFSEPHFPSLAVVIANAHGSCGLVSTEKVHGAQPLLIPEGYHHELSVCVP